MNEFPSRSVESEIRLPAQGPRVCIVTGELEGPFHNGGVGSTNRGLALTLAHLGHAVDVLYTQVSEGWPLCLRGTFGAHVRDYARQGIRLRAIYNTARADDWQMRSYLVMQHLLSERYDLVFFDDIFGSGYYSLLARRTGAPALSRTTMVVTAHGALEWVSEQDEAAILNFEGLALFEMERRSLELADLVKAPSRYILDKYRGYGWTLPAETVVMPNFVSEPKTRRPVDSTTRVPVEEIVFFGRLETRKGIWLFLRAIDRIKYRLRGRTVSFLGKSRATDALILRHSMTWPFEIKLLTQFNQDQAVSYLRGPGRLAVMPSPEDNSPSTVLECLDEGIAFLTSSGSGAQELIDPACHAANLFTPTVDCLAQKLLEAVETGASIARHAHDPARLMADFTALLDRLPQLAKGPASGPGRTQGPDGVLAIAPSGLRPEAVVARLTQARSDLGRDSVFHVLADTPGPLRALLVGTGIHVHGPEALGKAAEAIAAAGPRAVALCHVAAIPSGSWFDRAAGCLAGGLQAVTGLAASATETRDRIEEPWFSLAKGPAVERLLTGNFPTLLTLEQGTNSGFAVLRPEVLGLLGKLDSHDRSLGKSLPPSVIIHELMAAITATDGRFELIPDLPGPASAQGQTTARSSEGIALRNAARWYSARTEATEPALWAVNRLAVDAGIDRIRKAEGRAYREDLSHRFGFHVNAVEPTTPLDQHAAELARMAAAAGHSDLAVEILANLYPDAGRIGSLHLMDLVRAEAGAIDLLARYRSDACTPINLIHSYSVALLSDHDLQLHANTATEPRAALAFSELDLSGLTTFSTRASLPDAQSRPVRVRVDILAERGPGRLSVERVLEPGETTLLTGELPPDLRAMAKVIIGVEMADPLAPNSHAYIRLNRPRLHQLIAGARP